MRVYGNIYTAFWNNDKVHPLSNEAKLLALYLLSSSHSNMLGCFRLPYGYVAEDLNWSVDIVSTNFQVLQAADFLIYDLSMGWVLICNFLKWNPIANPNQGKGIEKLFLQLPERTSFYPFVLNNLFSYKKHLSPSFLNHLETVSKLFLNQEQEQNQKQNQKKDINMSGKPDVSPLDDSYLNNRTKDASYLCHQLQADALEVLEFLNQKTGRCYRPVEANLKLIIGRLASGVTLVECRQVIAKKSREWKNNEKMEEYLRPATLFHPLKFEQYLGELLHGSEGGTHES